MKKKILTAILAFSLMFSISACRSENETTAEAENHSDTEQSIGEETEEETAPAPEYLTEHRGRDITEVLLTEIDPAACEPSFREFLSDFYADYQALMQALIQREPQVSVEPNVADSLVRHMQSSPYGVLCDSVQISEGQITFVYRFDEEEHQRYKTQLDELFLNLINEHVSASDNEMEKVLALYQGLMEIPTNGTYVGNSEEIPDLLNVLESGDAQSSQFAEILSFCLQLLDIEAFPMVVEADYPEVIVSARIGDQFYFFDPFYEAMASMGDGLMGFGMRAEDLMGYLGSSEAALWNAQGEYSWQTLNLIPENPFAAFRTIVSWNWGQDHTIEITDLHDQSYCFRTDSLSYEGEEPSAAIEARLEEMYPVFDSIVRTMYEQQLSYDPSDNTFVWNVLVNFCCNYGYYFSDVSYEETGYVHVPAETMQELIRLCFPSASLSGEIPEGISAELLADGSYRLALIPMSENWIRVEDIDESETGHTAEVGYYHPGSEPGEEEQLLGVTFSCTPMESPAGSDGVLAFSISEVTEE